MKVANEQNLIPFSERTESEQREIRSKGGKASGKKRRLDKTQQEILIEVMQMMIVDPKLVERMRAMGFADDNITYQRAYAVAKLNAALGGNTKAMDSIDEMLDEGIKSKQLKETKRYNNAKIKIEQAKIQALSEAAENISESDIKNANIRSICDIIIASGQTGLKEGD